MPFILLLLGGLAFCSPLILSTERNEGAFSIGVVEGKVCVVGRMESEDSYDALVGTLEGESFFRISSEADDYSYTVESYKGRCIAGITTLARGRMDMALVEFGEGKPKVLKVFGDKGDDMLWFLKKISGGYLLVGGVRKEDWDVLVVRLDEDLEVLWSLRIGTEGEEYAYGAVEKDGRYYVVGRSNYRGNWDGFLLELTPGARLERSILVGSEAKDYFRFVGIFGDKVVALGRSEMRGGSDAWLFSEGRSFLYDGGEFDYGRVFIPWDRRLVLMGDTYREAQSDGMLVFLDARFEVLEGYEIGGDGIESVRFLIPEGWFSGYSYSFTIDNDILLGNVRDLCPGFVRRKNYERFEVPMEVYSYPVRVSPYALKELDLEFEVEEVKLKRIDPCLPQE